jgi:hypothetical protein
LDDKRRVCGSKKKEKEKEKKNNASSFEIGLESKCFKEYLMLSMNLFGYI